MRPDIDNWVRDWAPKFVSRATFKNLNRWHRVFDVDRRESIAFWLQYCLGLRLFLLLWATEVVCCPLGLWLLWKNRARRSRSRKKACESVFGAALSLRGRSCRRVFCCPVSGAVDFLLSSSYFFWVVWNLVHQGQLVSWRASRPLFGPHGENFDFSRSCGTLSLWRGTQTPLPLRAGCVGKFFSAPRAIAYLVLEFGVHRCGCLGVDVQSDSAEVHNVRLSCLWKIFACRAKVRGRALRNAGGQSSLDPRPRGRPCRVAKMFSLAFDSQRGLPSKKNYSFSMQQRKAHLQCKCSWHTHTGSLVTHAAPSHSQTSRGTSPEAGTMTKKLLLRVHASPSFFFSFTRLRDAEKHRLQVLVARFCLTISCIDALAIFLTTAIWCDFKGGVTVQFDRSPYF